MPIPPKIKPKIGKKLVTKKTGPIVVKDLSITGISKRDGEYFIAYSDGSCTKASRIVFVHPQHRIELSGKLYDDDRCADNKRKLDAQEEGDG